MKDIKIIKKINLNTQVSLEKQSKQIRKKTLVKQPSITYHSPKKPTLTEKLKMSLRYRSWECNYQTSRDTMNQWINKKRQSNNLLELRVHRLEREPSLLKQKPNQCEAKNTSFKQHLPPQPSSMPSQKKQNNLNLYQETKNVCVEAEAREAKKKSQ